MKENRMKNLNFSQDVLAQAQTEAKAMAESGEKIRKFKFGRDERGGNLWIAADAELVIGGTKIEVEGRAFYVALFRKE